MFQLPATYMCIKKMTHVRLYPVSQKIFQTITAFVLKFTDSIMHNNTGIVAKLITLLIQQLWWKRVEFV